MFSLVSLGKRTSWTCCGSMNFACNKNLDYSLNLETLDQPWDGVQILLIVYQKVIALCSLRPNASPIIFQFLLGTNFKLHKSIVFFWRA